jgi:putative endonuclease
MRVKDAVGRFGERLAADHLRAAGLTILATNWRCPAGELDIIARDGATLVFVEVNMLESRR